MLEEVKKLREFSEKLFQLAYLILENANISVTDKGIANPQILAVTLLIRNISNLKGVVALIEANLIVEARILTRSCYENLLWVGRLSSDGVKFVKEMQEHELRNKKTLGEYVLGRVSTITQETKEKLQDQLKEIKERGGKLKFLNVSDVASKNVVEIAYLAYSQLSSDAAHPSLTALCRYLSYSEENGVKVATADVNPVFKSTEIIDTLSSACDVFIGVCVGVNQILGYTAAGQRLTEIMTEYESMSKTLMQNSDGALS